MSYHYKDAEGHAAILIAVLVNTGLVYSFRV
jgi:hypothetical protein